MLHWLLILVGIFILSCSISNPLYGLTIKKYLKLNSLMNLVIRIFIFILGVIIVFLGLYYESIS